MDGWMEGGREGGREGWTGGWVFRWVGGWVQGRAGEQMDGDGQVGGEGCLLRWAYRTVSARRLLKKQCHRVLRTVLTKSFLPEVTSESPGTHSTEP